MEKKIGILFILLLFRFSGQCQMDSSEVTHGLTFGFNGFSWRDTHTMYGYQLTSGKNSFNAAVSIERKRYIWYFNNPLNLYQNQFYEYSFYRENKFSITSNLIELGHSYSFRPQQKLNLFTFINFLTLYYRDKGVFEGEVEQGIFVTTNYKFNHIELIGNLGIGFCYNINQRFSIKQQFGAGVTFVFNYFDSDYTGPSKNNSWWMQGFAKFIVSYNIVK